LASNGYHTSCRTRRRRQQLFRIDFRGRDPFDADDDPAAKRIIAEIRAPAVSAGANAAAAG